MRKKDGRCCPTDGSILTADVKDAPKTERYVPGKQAWLNAGVTPVDLVSNDHSTMGVATGSKTVSTNFDVPSSMETGPSSLKVVANGIPSAPVAITVN